MVNPIAIHMQMVPGRPERAVDDRYSIRKATRIIIRVMLLPDMEASLLCEISMDQSSGVSRVSVSAVGVSRCAKS